MFFPKGWKLAPDGHAVWANGCEYISSGAQNGRVEVVEAFSHLGAIVSYEWPPSLKAANRNHVRDFMATLTVYFDKEEAALKKELEKIEQSRRFWTARVESQSDRSADRAD